MPNFSFFDLHLASHTRHPASIAHAIENLSPGNKYQFIYDEKDGASEKEILKKLPVNSEIIYSGFPSKTNINHKLTTFEPDALIVMAQRIPDSAYVSIAKTLNIKTFMFQHGLYIPFSKREPSLFFKKFVKSLRYIICVLTIAETIKEDKIKYLQYYIKNLVSGQNITGLIDKDKINVDKVLVYGNFWKEYHHQLFGYSDESQYVIGYPDLIKVKDISSLPQENSICYIAQTLVEDGRLSRDIFLDFIKILSSCISNDKKIYIKLHPRSDLSLYKQLKEFNKAEFCNNNIPHCTHYIGHYSTLVAVIAMVNTNVLLWNFEGHEIPSYFADVCRVKTADVKQLVDFINNYAILENEYENNLKSQFQNFFYFDGEDPLQKTAKIILNSVKR
ncbi:MAG: polysialyltransferase family glycosyltransferase [Dolichospermum sp.]